MEVGCEYAMIRNELKTTHAALVARASWNSYENTCPVAPTVLAIECVKDAEPVPENSESGWKSERQAGLEQMTCFNYDTAGSDVKPRGDKRNIGEIEDLCSMR
jgi:hypothetical protein